MKRRWKIAMGVVLGLLVLAGSVVAWVVTRPVPMKLTDPGPNGRRVADGRVFGNYFPAPGEGRKPGILLLGGSEGGLGRDVHRQALLLQNAGFNVLHLAYFNAPGKPSRLAQVPLEGFFAGLDWLKAQGDVKPAAVALVGYSKGAEAALSVATRYPGVKAVVAGMPSSVVWDGLSFQSFVFGGNSSWSLRGKQLPSLPYGSGDGGKDLLPRFVNGLKKLPEHRDAIIPVERFGGNLLMVCGGRDTLWPSCPMARTIETRARRAGRPAVELIEYPEAGHGVMGAPLPAEHAALKRWGAMGGTAQANAKARADSWPKIVSFLRAALAPEHH